MDDLFEVEAPVRSRPRVQIFFDDCPSLTRQEFKDECDLGKILERFRRTPEGEEAFRSASGFAEECRFDDVSCVPDFRASRDTIIAAEAKFMALPPMVRRRFDNDAAAFLDFVQDPKNLDEARALGLCKPAPQDAVKADTPK